VPGTTFSELGSGNPRGAGVLMVALRRPGTLARRGRD